MPGRRLTAVVVAALMAASCEDATTRRDATPIEPPPQPVIVIGIDGAEWRVIEDLWRRGELPHLKGLAERGVRATLATDYGISPVIWTTIATGVEASEHGITTFVVATDEGDVPVTSTLRRRPALWNMLSNTGRKVAVLGWWASWPAEPVHGTIVSDRALDELEARVHPQAYLPTFLADLEAAAARPTRFQSRSARQDEVMAATAVRLASEDFDLLMVYLRGVDLMSHRNWIYYEPDRFAEVDPDELAERRDRIPEEYRAVDEAIGRLVATARPDSRFFVVSDHGFAPIEPKVRINFDVGALLEHFGYLTRTGDAVDPARSLLVPLHSAGHIRQKRVRFSSAVGEADRAGLRARLEADLATVRYASGAPACRVRAATWEQAAAGVDFVIEVLNVEPSETVVVDGAPLAGVVKGIHRITGGHDGTTPGIFIAAGPGIDSRADVDGIDIHDLTPTFLYALGLPIARDFAGRAWTELFTAEFRDAYPERRIASWGTTAGGPAVASEGDEALVDQLRALGYLDD